MNGSEILRALYTQVRVIHAVALRETRTRYGANKLGYVWALAEPLTWIGLFWGMYHVLGRGDGPFGMPLIPFLATGYIPYQIVVTTADRAATGVDSNLGLLFYPHVQPLDLIIARGGLEIATGLTVLATVLAGVAMYDQAFTVADPLKLLTGLGLAAMLGLALGTLFCAASVLTKTVDRVRGHAMKPLFWTSGIYFAANSIPPFARKYMMFNPILQCVEMIRDGLFPQYHQPDADPLYVCAWILGLGFVGLTLERRVRPKLELT